LLPDSSTIFITDRQFDFSSKGGVFTILFFTTAHLSTLFPATTDLFKFANNKEYTYSGLILSKIKISLGASVASTEYPYV
jgi:hypothetical protein